MNKTDAVSVLVSPDMRFLRWEMRDGSIVMVPVQWFRLAGGDQGHAGGWAKAVDGNFPDMGPR